MTTDVQQPTVLERLEAECRRRMAVAARLKTRGWDSQREKADAIADVDEVLDLIAEMTEGPS